MEGDTITLQGIFRFRGMGVDAEGRANGIFETTGAQPNFAPKLLAAGMTFSPDFFAPRNLSKS